MITFYTSVLQNNNNQIMYRGYENGVRVQKLEPFCPTLFVETQKPTSAYRSISGLPLDPITFHSISDAKEFTEQYKGVNNFHIYGNENYIYQYIAQMYSDHRDVECDISSIRILNIDIENESEGGFCKAEDASEKINVITMRWNSKKWVLAIHDFFLPQNPDVIQQIFATEEAMLEEFIRLWREIDPDVITGWNCKFYDIPYLVNRISNLFGRKLAKTLSPWDKIYAQETEFRGKTQQTWNICGIEILDYYELYRKYVLVQQASYKLDHIAEVELGKKKLDYSEYNNIREFYRGNFQKFVEYNVQDVDLVSELDAKLNLIGLHIGLAYTAKCNYDDAFKQIRMWDCIIYYHLLKSNIIIPLKEHKEKNTQFAGAYVKDPIVGFHDWVVSYDVASMYPNIIRMLNISPEMLLDVEKLNILEKDALEDVFPDYKSQYGDVCLGLNGALFSKNKQGMTSELVSHFYNLRKQAKKEMVKYKKELEVAKNTDANLEKELKQKIALWDTKQMTGKIAINSLYGVMGSPYFRFYNIAMAEAVTKTGRYIIEKLQIELNKKFNKMLGTQTKDYCPASDTDSLFLKMDGFVNAAFTPDQQKDKNRIVNYLDKFCKTILDEFIEKEIKKINIRLNAKMNSIEMARDVIADRGLWKAKKMYCLNVHDSEGVRYAEPKLKIMGIEVQRSSTPNLCRGHLKKCVKLILTENEKALIDHVRQVKEIFFKATPEEIAFPRGVNGMEKFSDSRTLYKKGTPIHVKGSIIYNHVLDKMKLDKTYEKIGEGEKIKFVYLKEPNLTGIKVLSFPSKIPKEFNIRKYVDYELQFQKTFLDPITALIKSTGWKCEETNSLESFFE